MVKIGIIGGSGLDNPGILHNARDLDMDTVYGKPSSLLKMGTINCIDVVLLARHGREHTIPPSQVNFRANIAALKQAGCTHILATTACGSLREEIGRGDFVIIDQFIDFTKHRKFSFHEAFSPHAPVHCPMAEPFSKEIREVLIETCGQLNLKYHPKGTVITIEGPRFSTKAESKMFRQWGADVINMSIAPECSLANEAGIPYAAIAMSTDYDCWKEDEAPVTWEAVLEIFSQNVKKVTELLTKTIPKMENLSLHKVKSKIRTVPHWPKQGIMFRDITTLLKDPEGFNQMMDLLVKRYKEMDIDVIAGIESRGFIMGAALANRLGIGFVPIRKKGKLPAEVISEEYDLEYGKDKIEVHKDSILPGQKVLLVDDLVATAGTAGAACRLIKKLGGEVVECAFVVELPELGGREKLEKQGYKVFALLDFEGE